MSTEAGMADGIAESLSFQRPYEMVQVRESLHPEFTHDCRVYVNDMHPFNAEDMALMSEMGWEFHTFRTESGPIDDGTDDEPHVPFHSNIDP